MKYFGNMQEKSCGLQEFIFKQSSWLLKLNKKLSLKKIKVVFRNIYIKVDLLINRVGDTSHKLLETAMKCNLVLMENAKTEAVLTIF